MKRLYIEFSWIMVALAFYTLEPVMAQSTGSLKLTLSDNGGVSDTVRFGELYGATSGIDVSLGEFELPPLPPTGAFDVRWLDPGVEGLSIDYRDTVSAQHEENVWTLQFQPSSSGYPVTITWDSTKLWWGGSFQMCDVATGGTKLNVDISSQERVTIADATIKSLTIVHTFTVNHGANFPPSAPQNLLAASADGQVALTWNRNTEADFLEYRIYCGTTSGNETLVDSSSASITDTTHIVIGLTNGATYYFKVTAMDSARLESGFSNEVSAVPSAENPLPVEATGFKTVATNGAVVLTWQTQSEINNLGFNVIKKDAGKGVWSLIASYTSDPSLRGLGTSTTGREYSCKDCHIVNGHAYEYTVESVSSGGTKKDYPPVQVKVDIPKDYALYQNYPNPFNPATTIGFDLKETSSVTLELFNGLGQKVEEWNYGTMNAGRYNQIFDMRKFSSGVYYYRIDAVGNDGQEFASMKKMLMLK
jgi:hypothetical protein